MRKPSIDNELISFYSFLVDVHGISIIIDFFNEYQISSSKSHLFISKLLNTISYEIIIYFDKMGISFFNDLQRNEIFTEIKKLRQIIHQFEHSKFDSQLDQLTDEMGRSNDDSTPMLDLRIFYSKTNNKYLFWGTNINYFKFNTINHQEIIYQNQSVIRVIDSILHCKDGRFALKKSKGKADLNSFAYSYVDIRKNSYIESERLLNRLLIAFEELTEIGDFFSNTILVDYYLMESSQMVYFLMKMLYIQLDDTLDNLINFISNASTNNPDLNHIKKIVSNVEEELIDKCRYMRNNLHYEVQKQVLLGDVNNMYSDIVETLVVIEKLRESIRSVLNIKINNYLIYRNKFLEWVGQ